MADSTDRRRLTLRTRKNLYESAHLLRRDSSRELGIFLDGLWAYVQDPRVAASDPERGIQPLEVKWEPGLRDGPVSARFAVLDYNADSGALVPPAKWDRRNARFTGPDGQPLDPSRCDTFQFHQVNVWAVAQSVLDMYEAPQALGRPIPWAFEGNRLILVPHAGYDENAYYDRHSKSLQFYYRQPQLAALHLPVARHHRPRDGSRRTRRHSPPLLPLHQPGNRRFSRGDGRPHRHRRRHPQYPPAAQRRGCRSRRPEQR